MVMVMVGPVEVVVVVCTVWLYVITQLSYVELRYPSGNTVHTTAQYSPTHHRTQIKSKLPGIKYNKSMLLWASFRDNVGSWKIIFIFDCCRWKFYNPL